ncbi:MAG: metallophosphoesterase [Actinomycetota bacterium]|nr:metallophosphoesterase [Actinomycetota bacterium]
MSSEPTDGHRRVSRRHFIGAGGAAAVAFALYPSRVVGAARGDAGFAFGLVADPQYCDCPDRRTRHYRASLDKLAEAARTFNAHDLSFTAQVGDIIDRHEASFDDILPVFERVRGPKHHVLGNHDFPIPADEVVARLGMPGRYYHFRREGWRFIVLDTSDVSLHANPPGSEKYELAEAILADLERRGAVNAKSFNGAVGDEQLAWLRHTLAGAARRGEKVIVLSHMPVHPEGLHNAWNDEVVVEALEAHGNVVAYFNGHNHQGDYGERDGIHYLTLRGMVELDTNAYAIVRVRSGRLDIEGYGREPDRVLEFAASGMPA